jgi:hypothetical protein
MGVVNWSEMTPLEVFESVRSAPRVAGPWTGGGALFRRAPDGTVVAAEYEGEAACIARCNYPRDSWQKEYPNRDAADAALREAGWLLVGG